MLNYISSIAQGDLPSPKTQVGIGLCTGLNVMKSFCSAELLD
jgi:hypothetical protein